MTIAASETNHQRCQMGRRMVKVTAAGSALTTPSEFTARTRKLCRPAGRLA